MSRLLAQPLWEANGLGKMIEQQNIVRAPPRNSTVCQPVPSPGRMGQSVLPLSPPQPILLVWVYGYSSSNFMFPYTEMEIVGSSMLVQHIRFFVS